MSVDDTVCLRFNSHFPGEPGLAGTRMSPFWIYSPELRMKEVVVTTGAIVRAKLQSKRHHQQTDTRLFTGRMPFLSPNQQCQSTEGKCEWYYLRRNSHVLQIFRPEGITTGNRTFRHLHDSVRRQRDGYRYGDQRAVSCKLIQNFTKYKCFMSVADLMYSLSYLVGFCVKFCL